MDPAQNIEMNQTRTAASGLKQVINGAAWLIGAYGVVLASRYLPIPFALRGWLPLIARIVAEFLLIGGLLKVADGPERWQVRELAIFGGLSTLPRPLLWAMRMALVAVHVDWASSSFLLAVVVLLDAGAFASIAFAMQRIDTGSGGPAQNPLAMGCYVAAGLLALSTVLEMFGLVPTLLPLSTLAGLGLAITLFLLVRQVYARVAR